MPGAGIHLPGHFYVCRLICSKSIGINEPSPDYCLPTCGRCAVVGRIAVGGNQVKLGSKLLKITKGVNGNGGTGCDIIDR